MKKELLIAFGIGAVLILGFGFMLLFKPGNDKSIAPHVAMSEQVVTVSEFTSPGVIKVLQYELGEFSVELKDQKNCIFKSTLSLGYEKQKAAEALKILQSNEIQIKQYIESFLLKQSSEKIKNFSTEQNLEIEMVNGINKLLKQVVVLLIYRKNSILDCK